MKGKGAKPTAVLMDDDGKIGQAYGARTTPHMFVIDPQGKLVYAGAIDSKPTARKDDVKSRDQLRADRARRSHGRQAGHQGQLRAVRLLDQVLKVEVRRKAAGRR